MSTDEVTISIKNWLGIIGSITLFIGVFAPLLGVADLREVNFFDYGKNNGYNGFAVLLLAVVAFWASGEEQDDRLLNICGCVSLGIVLYRFYYANEFAKSFAIEFYYGWLLLIGGSVLLLVSAFITTEESTEESTD